MYLYVVYKPKIKPKTVSRMMFSSIGSPGGGIGFPVGLGTGGSAPFAKASNVP